MGKKDRGLKVVKDKKTSPSGKVVGFIVTALIFSIGASIALMVLIAGWVWFAGAVWG